MNNLFNTEFEVSMRLLLLLSNVNKPMTKDEIAYLDFITIYSNTYGFDSENLNGECVYPLNELTIQMKLIQESIKSLVVTGFIKVTPNKDKGFVYTITNDGIGITQSMSSDYSADYKKSQYEILNKIGDINIKKLKELSKKKGW